MPPTGVQDLAFELVQEIVIYASHGWDNSWCKDDLSQLRLVSRPFKAAADPYLFSEITFDFVRRPLSGVIEQLNDMAERKTSVCRYIKTLIIGSAEVELPGLIAQGRYRFLLMHVLKSLHNVRSIRWTLDRFMGIDTVLDGIVDLPLLEEVFFDFSTLPVNGQKTDMFVLRRFARLQSLSFRGKNLSSSLAHNLIQQLRRLTATQQLLKSLDFEFRWTFQDKDTYPEDCILHEVVKDIPRETPLKLSCIYVRGWNLRLDPITLPHLRHLVSLDISAILDTGPDLQANIWNGLHKAKIQLKNISTGVISRPFIHYLISYTGVEHLTISPLGRVWPDFYSPDDTDESFGLCSELYLSVLSVHKSALKTFKILDTERVELCVTLDYMAIIRTCERLDSLAITFDVRKFETPDEDFRHILSTALGIPNLRNLEVLQIELLGDVSRRPINMMTATETMYYLESTICSLDVLRDFSRSLGSIQIIFNRKRYVAQVVANDRVQFEVESWLLPSGKWMKAL